MFVRFGERRINMSLVKQYKPMEKSSYVISDKNYFIEFTFLDGSQEELYFFNREEERNEYLSHLDQNLLPNIS